MCADGSLGAVMHVPGFSFELEEMGVRNVRRRQINALLRNVADDNVTIAAHLVRHRLVPDFPSGAFTSPFARRLDQRIRDTQAGRMFANDWFLTIMVSPRAGVQRTIASAWERVKPQRFRKPPQPSESRLRALEDRVLALTAYFQRAGIRRLGVRTDRDRAGVLGDRRGIPPDSVWALAPGAEPSRAAVGDDLQRADRM